MDASFFRQEMAAASPQAFQRRAAQTIQRIKKATLDLIVTEGYVAASTNRIAQRAEVNIASLYRFFPNRQSIVVALYQEASDELGRLVNTWVAGNLNLPPEQTMRGLIDLLVSFMDREHVALLRMHDEVPEVRAMGRGMLLEALGTEPNLRYLEQQFGDLDPTQLRLKLYFVQTFSMSMIGRYVMDRPAGLSQAEFVSELSLLVVAYLRCGDAGSAVVASA